MYWGLGSGTGDVIGGQLVGAFGARNTFWIMAVVSVVNLIIFTIAQKVCSYVNIIEMVKLASSQYRFYFDVHKVCGKLGRGKLELGGW